MISPSLIPGVRRLLSLWITCGWWVVNLIITSPHPAVQAQCSSTQETLLRVEFNKLLVDHRVLDRLQLSRDQVNCYYKYIKRVNDDSHTFEEVINDDNTIIQ